MLDVTGGVGKTVYDGQFKMGFCGGGGVFKKRRFSTSTDRWEGKGKGREGREDLNGPLIINPLKCLLFFHTTICTCIFLFSIPQ